MGVTYKQGKIMKNIYKSFALLCMGLAATACIEENFENNGPFKVTLWEAGRAAVYKLLNVSELEDVLVGVWMASKRGK